MKKIFKVLLVSLANCGLVIFSPIFTNKISTFGFHSPIVVNKFFSQTNLLTLSIFSSIASAAYSIASYFPTLSSLGQILKSVNIYSAIVYTLTFSFLTFNIFQSALLTPIKSHLFDSLYKNPNFTIQVQRITPFDPIEELPSNQKSNFLPIFFPDL